MVKNKIKLSESFKKKEEPKICAICKKEIRSDDNYCRLTDYKNGVLFMESFYHTFCYNNQIRGLNPEQTKMKKVAFSLLGRAQKLMNKVEGKPEEVYEVV